METQPLCPSCGKPLEPSAPKGLCPECLMKGAFPTGTDTGGRPVLFVPPKIEELASKFPQLEILEFIGQGGMGAVYKARQKQLDRIVALKILPPQAATGPGFAERFAHEARALAKLNHPHIVTLYEFGQADGLFYFLMEFVDGLNLGHLLRDRKLAPKEALAIVPQICDALQYAHEHGIVHRDIKPENILLSKEGQVKIADFGVAKIVTQGLEEAAGTSPAASAELTQAGSALGTPQYMAPEQIKNSAEVDHRADIYSLGVVFYQMLTGELPEGNIEPPSKKVHIDVRLDEVVLRALEKKPEMRYQEVSVLKSQVETIAQTPGGVASDVEAFKRAVLARDYSLNIGDCLNRGWNLLMSDFWPIVGVSALIWLLSTLATSSVFGITVSTNHAGERPPVPFATSSLLGSIVHYPLMGGLWLYFLSRIRRNPATLETAFSGFKVAFLQLVLVGLITNVLTVLGFLCLIVPGIYFGVAWTFGVALVADKRLDFWPAMEISRKVISRHWWKFFWFFIVLILIRLAGFALCYVGTFVAMPLCLAAMAYAYEDIVGAISPVPANAPAGATAPARSGGGLSVPARLAVGIAAAAVAIAFIGFLAAFAIALARHRAVVLYERQINETKRQQLSAPAHALEPPPGRSDYVGQAYSPYGDYIQITSVGRSHDRMTVKGVYTLVSADSATLALQINTNANDEPIQSRKEMQISKGSGNFTLNDSHVVPGLPRLTMYSTNADTPFAELYFGTKDEAAAESKLHLTHSQETVQEQNAKESERQRIVAMRDMDMALDRQFGKSDYIGQAYFPYGDSIKITSVERSFQQVTIRGHYNLVSADHATLTLLLTTNTVEPIDSIQNAMQISKGQGDFILVNTHVPMSASLPHIIMYSTNSDTPFAELYFGTEAEAGEESNLHLTHSQEMALERESARSDFIGQGKFARDNTIEITSVERVEDRMTVSGHYKLASADTATLALLIASTNRAYDSIGAEQEIQISKGSGDFTLINSNVVPGLPHLDMYPTNGGHPFAELYFGTQAEALEESHMDLPPTSGSQQEICVDNLRLIEAAKQQWALENKKTRTDVPTWEDLVPYLSPDIENTNVLKCPSGGVYTVGPMSKLPTCSIPGHALP